MDYKQLFLFVEGPDDERFFTKIIKPVLEKTYSFVKIISYATMPKENVVGLLKTIKNQASNDYIFVSDFDARGDTAFCVSARKEKISNKYNYQPELDKIQIVKEEIESWYFAGIEIEYANKKGITLLEDTEMLTKEDFETKIPKNKTKLDFMLELLNHYNIEEAKEKNTSFLYFTQKYF